MTDIEATDAISELMQNDRKHKRLKNHAFRNCKFAYRYEVEDMIQEAILSAWVHREIVENFGGYVWGSLTKIAWNWNVGPLDVTSQLYSEDSYSETGKKSASKMSAMSGIFRKSSEKFLEEQNLNESLDLVENCLDSLRGNYPLTAGKFDEMNDREFTVSDNHSKSCDDTRVRLRMRAIRTKIEKKYLTGDPVVCVRVAVKH